jgi:hypothetical protein
MEGWTGGWSGMNCTSRLLLILLLVLAVGAFAQDVETPGIHPSRRAATVDVFLIPLSGPLAQPKAEVSGLTWLDETLVILPQFPDIFGHGDILGFFILEKADIVLRLGELKPAALLPEKVDCEAAGMMRIISGFDGLEAMGIMGDRVYMTVEAKGDTSMAGYLVCGHYDMQDNQVAIDMTRLTSIPMGVNIPNVAEESMIISGEKVITFSEANGRNITDNPQAKVFDKEINFLGSIPFPSIEYRVTDATALDDEGCFWVINYYYPGDEGKLKPAPDPELEKFGLPEGWTEGQCVERLLELRLVGGDRIVRTGTPPINLRLSADGRCRNWEAIVRLDDSGFLLMTDKYPGTLLAFVPNPFGN